MNGYPPFPGIIALPPAQDGRGSMASSVYLVRVGYCRAMGFTPCGGPQAAPGAVPRAAQLMPHQAVRLAGRR